MIVFAIPFRAKETTKDWNSCLKRLEHTLDSVFNQTDPNFKCILVCNSVPEKWGGQYDDRLEIIKTDLAIPQKWIEMSRDKFWKLTIAAVRIHEILMEQSAPEKGIFVMPVDADDILNCRIAQWCEEHPEANGAVSEDGYVWEEGSRYMRIYPQMHTYCGSCSIIKMFERDLPAAMPYPDELSLDRHTAGILNARYPIRYDHNTVVQRYADEGKPFEILPFRSTIYVRATGENISGIAQKEAEEKNSQQGRRFHPVAMIRKWNVLDKKRLTKGIRREFGIEYG